MPKTAPNAQYEIPGQKTGTAEFATDPRFGEQTSARLQLEELFRGAEPSKIVIDTTNLADSARAFANPRPEQLTFADYEKSLTHIGRWLAYDRKEVGNNGLPV